MEIRNLYQPFEMHFLEVEKYEAKKHKNTFFEMIFVLGGDGIQIINNHRLPYKSNKLFLLFPEDTHGFEVNSTTQFFFIRFNTSYLKTQSTEWIQKIEFIFHNHNSIPGCVLKTTTDKPLVRAMVEALHREALNKNAQEQEIVKQLINTIITIVARNISLNSISTEPTATPDTINLLTYIHQNIFQPQQLKAEKIALQFNIAPTYVSEYFKSKTGHGIQQYIMEYKIKLIETRLRYTSMQINEIVYEFGFSDASHLNRLFKKYNGVNPSEYRKSFSIDQ